MTLLISWIVSPASLSTSLHLVIVLVIISFTRDSNLFLDNSKVLSSDAYSSDVDNAFLASSALSLMAWPYDLSSDILLAIDGFSDIQ